MNTTLTLTNRTELNLTGIKLVKSSEPKQIVALQHDGSIIISGDGLNVQHLDIKEGVLQIGGTVNQIKYTNTVAKNFSIKNMFK